MLYIVKTPEGYPLFVGQGHLCHEFADKIATSSVIELVYAGCYSLLADLYDVTAWNKAGDFGYFDDEGFAEVFSVDSRDSWVS